jgi:hypothetical protein
MSIRGDLAMVARVLMQPIVQLVLRVIPKRDPWTRVSRRVPLSLYGRGSQRDFGWYLEGESTVRVGSIEEIQDWLLACEYVEDRELFNETDFWQHPNTFERLRRGDCEDHALWAWRKLVELGVDAELVSGRQLSDGDDRTGHVWVVVHRDGDVHVFETVAKRREMMLRPLSAVRDLYRPEVSVNGRRERFAYHGYLWTLREQRPGTQLSPRATPHPAR